MYIPLSSNDVSIRGFNVYKAWDFTEANASGSGIKVLTGSYVSYSVEFDIEQDSNNFDGSSKRLLYNLVNHLYYKTGSGDEETVYRPENPMIEYSQIPYFKGKLNSDIRIISIPQQIYGEKILPGSIKLTSTYTSDTYISNGTFVGLSDWVLEDVGGGYDWTYVNPGARIGKAYDLHAPSNAHLYISTSLSEPLLPNRTYKLEWEVINTTGSLSVYFYVGDYENSYYICESGVDVTVTESIFTTPDDPNVNLSLFGMAGIGLSAGSYTKLVLDNLTLYRISEYNIIDDKNCNLYNSTYSASFATGSTPQIGNVFYDSGIIILTNTGSYSTNEDSFSEVLTDYTLEFSGSHTIYELEAVCNVKENELNYTQNPTALISGSVSLIPLFTHSGSFIGTASYGEGPTTMSYADLDARPFITTIGLYNDSDELIAVGKFARPIQKENYLDMGFIVKLDL